MNKKIILLILFCLTFLFLFIFIIQKNSVIKIKDTNVKNENSINKNNQSSKGNSDMNISVIIGDARFSATLENNDAAKVFVDMLPLEINMKELNGNEKYYYLDEGLPTNSYNPNNINGGDIMLYSDDCLVLFYETFKTSYSYTKLGSIDNPEGLKEILGKNNVTIRFEKNK